MVAVVDEPSDDEHGRGELEGGVAVADLAVGVAAELPVVRPPCVGCFDDPTQPEREPVRGARRWLGAAALVSNSSRPLAWSWLRILA